MKFIALKELPQGQQPGDIFEANEDQGRVLEAVGAARKADVAEAGASPRRRYVRRDLAAADAD